MLFMRNGAFIGTQKRISRMGNYIHSGAERVSDAVCKPLGVIGLDTL